MKISIVTVCYNSAETIFDTISSVKSQDYEDIEYILVDGDSSDSTVDIVQSFLPHMPIRFISEKDGGMWDAMNKGLSLASGEYVGFLNSDDFFSSSSIVSDIAETLVQTKSDAVFGFVDIVDASDTNIITRKYRVPKLSKSLLRMGIMPAHPGFFCKKKFFDNLGGFKLEERVAPDFELMVRFLVRGDLQATLVPKVLVKMRNGGLSNTNFAYILGRFRRQVYSCHVNGLWTNSLVVLAKYPYKLLEYLR